MSVVVNPVAKASIFREYAGVLTAQLIVVAFVLSGFLQMGAELFYSVKIVAPGDWSAAMLSLASAALGFLIGKQTTATPGPGAVSDTITLPIAPLPVPVGTTQTTTVSQTGTDTDVK